MLGVYLFCGIVGFAWTVGNFALGKVFGGGDHGADGAGDAGGGELGDVHADVGEVGEVHVEGEFGAGEAGGGEGHAVGDAGGDAGHVSLPLFSPTVIAGYLTGFGATGILLHSGFGIENPLIHVPGSLAGAAVMGVSVAYLTVKVLRAAETSSEARVANLIGRTGELTVGVPERGMGELAYLAGGGRSTAPVRSADGGAIARGTQVRILRREGPVYVVGPVAALEPPAAGDAAAPPERREKER